MRNSNYLFDIILELLKTDSTKRKTNRYENMYYCNKRIMNPKKRIKYQISIRELSLDSYKRKNITRQNSYGISKNKETGKQDYYISD